MDLEIMDKEVIVENEIINEEEQQPAPVIEKVSHFLR